METSKIKKKGSTNLNIKIKTYFPIYVGIFYIQHVCKLNSLSWEIKTVHFSLNSLTQKKLYL